MKYYLHKPVRVGNINISYSNENESLSIRQKRGWFGLRFSGALIRLGHDGVSYRSITRQKQNSSPISDSELLLVATTSKKLHSELHMKRSSVPLCPFALIFLPITKYGILISAVLLLLVYFFVDRPRRTALIYYDITPNRLKEMNHFYHSFQELVSCNAKWLVLKSTPVDNRKYNAGAETNVNRRRISIRYRTPSMIISNVSVPSIAIGMQRLCFFPDRALLLGNLSVQAISYSNLIITQSNQKYVEGFVMPPDSKQVGATNRFVNLDGSPDHRFKYNQSLPVLLYSELHLKDDSGFDMILLFSKPDAGRPLCESYKSYTAQISH